MRSAWDLFMGISYLVGAAIICAVGWFLIIYGFGILLGSHPSFAPG
jgi:hypothetical protein